MTLRKRLLPDGLQARFALLLICALLLANLIAAMLMAREGSAFDRLARVQRDMGRLVALVETLEVADSGTSAAILEHSSTGYTRFSIDDRPLDLGEQRILGDIVEQVDEALPGREIRAIAGRTGLTESDNPPLLVLSVRLIDGEHRGEWLNSLIWPLRPEFAWRSKLGFFLPLAVSLAVSLAAGLWFIRRMTAPLQQIAVTARAAGRGDRTARATVAGARELREAAAALNDMQQRIAGFDATRHALVAAISHDLRTPLTSLRIRAELIDDPAQSGPMIATIDQMTVMVEDLLSYSQGVARQEPFEDTDLTALLARLCGELGAAMAPAAPLRMKLRPVAIGRAAGNLISNALKFAGRPRVRLVPLAGGVDVIVEDDGPGITENQLKSVVEPFVRGESSRNSETGGLGLGLAIAQSVACDHGGSLTLKNRPGGGLSATLHLPFCPRSAADQPAGAPPR